MTAAFFSLLGLFLLIGVPVLSLYWSMTIGMSGVYILSGSSIGMSVLVFALAVIIDRLDRLVVASAKAGSLSFANQPTPSTQMVD